LTKDVDSKIIEGFRKELHEAVESDNVEKLDNIVHTLQKADIPIHHKDLCRPNGMTFLHQALENRVSNPQQGLKVAEVLIEKGEMGLLTKGLD